MTRRAFTPEQDQAIAARYVAGETLRRMAVEFGVSDVSVGNAVRRAGKPLRRPAASTASALSRGDNRAIQEEAVRRYVDDGWSIRQLAQHYKCNGRVLSRLFEERGVLARPGGPSNPRHSVEESRRIADEYEAGASLRALAEKYDSHMPAISNALKRVGVQTRMARRPKFWTPERRDRAVALYQNGWSQQQIAAELGTKQVAVSNVLRSEGVTSAGPRPSGSRHGSWRGGRVVTSKGYVNIRPSIEDMAYCRPNISGYVAEHRLVMGRAVGRPLHDWESVHHIDGDRTNNELANLQLRQGRHGAGVVMTCNSCGSHDVTAQEIAEPDAS